MVYIASGMKASVLIKKLEALIAKHGDKEVFAGGTDYPEGVESVWYVPKDKGNGYVPGDSFQI